MRCVPVLLAKVGKMVKRLPVEFLFLVQPLNASIARVIAVGLIKEYDIIAFCGGGLMQVDIITKMVTVLFLFNFFSFSFRQ